ncbi:WG repeat-containing protein, partial [Klebsiella pneumoniae]|uniref:WG repeat-containing protein n=1 Tax=Klebsiella pneumoniae TaxID=573 RepID=UPI002731D178
IYDDLGVFAQRRVFAKKDGKFGYLDRSGKTVIPFQFNEAKYFYKPGLAIVRQDKKYGLIDTLGNYVLADLYDKIDYSRGNEIAAVKQN